MYMMGMGEKPRNIYRAKTKEKIPVWLTPSNALVDMYLWRKPSPLCRVYNTIYVYPSSINLIVTDMIL